MPWNWLHSSTFSLQKENTIFSWFQSALSAQFMHHHTLGDLSIWCSCPSSWPPCYSHPKNQKATGTHILNIQLWAQELSWTSAHPAHQPLPSVPFHPSDPTGGTCPKTKINKTIAQLSRDHHYRGHLWPRGHRRHKQVAAQTMMHTQAKDHTGIPSLGATAHLHHLSCDPGSKIQVTPKSCFPSPRNLTQMQDPSQSFFSQLPM